MCETFHPLGPTSFTWRESVCIPLRVNPGSYCVVNETKNNIYRHELQYFFLYVFTPRDAAPSLGKSGFGQKRLSGESPRS